MSVRWARVQKTDPKLENILSRFQAKLAPLKKALDEEVEKLKKALEAKETE